LTNDYVNYSEDETPYLTWKGQIMNGFKIWIIIFAMIHAKLKGEKIFDDQ